MPALVWKHGTTKEAARDALQAKLKELGHADRVRWDGFAATARAGPFGSVLDAAGAITDEAVVVERCGGLAKGAVLRACGELLRQLFPTNG
jgi:hypothetical protein